MKQLLEAERISKVRAASSCWSAATCPTTASVREDIVVVVGQDGLVANTLKYLQGQPVIAVNPDRSDGRVACCRSCWLNWVT